MKSGRIRNYYAAASKPTGVYRIICIGDSYAYGSGVHIHETLPFLLEEILNKKVLELDIEVLNGGYGGFSIYDTWQYFLSSLSHYEHDFLILLLSSNDAELEKPAGNYNERRQAGWSESSRNYFSLMLQEIAAFLDQRRKQFLIAFYDTAPDSLPEIEHIRTFLSETTAHYHLPYLDLSPLFASHYNARFNLSMRVSEMDGHPSPLAHTFAAMFLADTLVRDFLTQSGQRLSEYERVQDILSHAREAIRLGYQPSGVFERLFSVLQAKHASPRQRLAGDFLPETEFSPLLADLHQENTLYAATLMLEGYIAYLTENHILWAAFSHLAHAKLNQAFKHFFIYRANLQNPDLNFYPALIQDYNLERHELSRIEHALKQILAQFQQSFSVIAALQAGNTPLVMHNLNLTDPQNRLFSLWSDIHAFCVTFERLVAAVQQAADGSSEQSKKLFKLILAELVEIMEAVQNIDRSLYLQGFCHTMNEVVTDNYMTIEIEGKFSAAHANFLLVEARIDIPPYLPIIEAHMSFQDDKVHVYRSRFPLFSKAELYIQASQVSKQEWTEGYGIRAVHILNGSLQKQTVTLEESQPVIKISLYPAFLIHHGT